VCFHSSQWSSNISIVLFFHDTGLVSQQPESRINPSVFKCVRYSTFRLLRDQTRIMKK
jgi:hypothetical protein